MPVQSVIFKKKYWDTKNARKWLKEHGFVYTWKVDKTENFLRFRQFNPKPNAQYITKQVPNYLSISLIISDK